jgi:hypothetical protein
MASCGLVRGNELLIEQDPCDLITLSDAFGSAKVKVRPLDLPDRRLPTDPQPTDKLIVTLVDEPTKTYEVQWSAIAKVELYERRVLAEAIALTAAGRLEEAFETYRFLEGHYPTLTGLPTAVGDFLFEEAKLSMRKQDYAGTLAMLRELHRRDPKRPGLDAAMALATERAVKQYTARGDYAAARRLFGGLHACFPDHPAAATGIQSLQQRAAQLFSDARQPDRDPLHAARLCREVELTWPDTAGAKAFAASLHAASPSVSVAIIGDAASPLVPDLGCAWHCDWSYRRDARLAGRRVCEFVAPDVGGGVYRCWWGEASRAKSADVISIELAAGRGPHGMPDAAMVAQAIAFEPRWNVRAVAARPSAVDMRLPAQHPHAEAVLATASLRGSADGVPSWAVPYQRLPREPQATVYALNPAYVASTAGTPRYLSVHPFATAADAVKALRTGKVAAIDRLPLAEVDKLSGDKRFVVRPYRVPLVHLLAPNLRRPYVADRAFRRALLYGLHREAILSQLLGDKTAAACRVVSGPFPVGFGPSDPLRYAVEAELKPRPFEPELAAAIVANGQSPQRIPLVLAYPPGDVAATASREIAAQWRLIGVDVELRELTSCPTALPDDVDWLYVELAVCEPMIDALVLFGDDGLFDQRTPAMDAALRRLSDAPTFEEAQAALRSIHRQVFEETTLLPLWQWAEYYAHRADLQGVGELAVGLYENVELWRPTFTWAEK